MPRIVPKSRMTPGGYGSTSAPKRKQRAEGEKSPRKTKKSKKSKIEASKAPRNPGANRIPRNFNFNFNYRKRLSKSS